MHKKTNEEFRTQVYKLVGDDYTFLEPYKDSRTPIMVRHNYCGAEYAVTPDNFLRGRRCSHCSHIRIQHRKSVTKKINDELAKYHEHLVGPYKNSKTTMLIQCNNCGLRFKRSYDLYQDNKACPFCSGNKYKIAWDTSTFAWYVDHVTNGQYKLMSDYCSAGTNVKILHKACGNTYEVMHLNLVMSV